ncbi:hypothetical protein IJH27_01430 [Candidatus Saccharibacteria bacterium]|nr:hypothetical protein [Candidatus Saccharibacteria bacterium]MBQ3464476.1 hypothetical protein [Candidatus Saccharibacteria bacterium]
MDQNADLIAHAISGSLQIIEQDRERKIVEKRFGLNGRKETLEQIGDTLSVTRERVRQLEKVILVRLRVAASENKIPELPAAEKIIIRNLAELGRTARLTVLAEKIYGRPATPKEVSSLAFLGDISSSLTVLPENDRYYHSLAISDLGDEKALRTKIDEIVSIIKAEKAPLTLDELDAKLTYEHPSQIAAVASASKLLATLNDLWGLAKWPTVNPKNIRDKIYVILKNANEPMHFNKIAAAIADSNFRRKNVTTQAIHNELIKDPRFVLIGRGIYALDTWGYKKGTVSEIITDLLKSSSRPLSREEIVAGVLKSRKVKETTILLNLQNKDLFERVEKNSYRLKSEA